MVDVPIGGTMAVEGAGAPLGIRLERNAPNPFNPSTTFRMTLPEAQQVRLVVFDIHGRQVRSLLDGVSEAGSQLVEWDGRDDAGRELASGVYVARFESAGLAESWKVVLAK
jgi:flagellar hook assembly protein FlgD